MIDLKTSKQIVSLEHGINLYIDVDDSRQYYFIILNEFKNLFPSIKKHENKFMIYIRDVLEIIVKPEKDELKSVFEIGYYYAKRDTLFYVAKLDLKKKVFSSTLFVCYNKIKLERFFSFNESPLSQKEIDKIPSEFKNLETKNKNKFLNDLFALCKKHEIKYKHISNERSVLARYVEDLMDSHFGLNQWAWEFFFITKGSQDVGSFCAPVLVDEILEDK